MQTREQAIDAYDTQLARLVNSLRALVTEVEKAGDPSPRPVGMSSQRVEPDRTILASNVHDLIMGWVGQRNSHLTCLMFAAIAAEHPGARGTPGELLDQAATALEPLLADGPTDEEYAADLVLRSVGVIR